MGSPKADYSIFIRPRRRSSDAGFPTKLAESMAVGTPVITNDTGDVGLYIKDGENGYLLSEGTADELTAVLKEILKEGAYLRRLQRRNARRTAEQVFDYRGYRETMTKFIDEVRRKEAK